MTVPIRALQRWWKAEPTTHGAALAYYSIFSLAPMGIILVVILGRFFGVEAVSGRLHLALQNFVGTNVSFLIQDLISYAYRPLSGLIAGSISVIVVIIAALALFGQVERAMTALWLGQEGIVPRTFLKSKIMAIIMVALLGILLIISFSLSTIITVFTHRYPDLLELGADVNFANMYLSFAYIFVLFTALYKYMPPTKVSWKAALIGGMTGGILFILGRYCVGFYITTSVATSVYGVAGAVLLVLLWFYYMAQIFFFGAALTYAVDQKPNMRQTLEESASQTS